MFAGSPGVTCRFISVARDRAGNEQPRPTVPGATVHTPVARPEFESVAVEPDGHFRVHAVGAPGIAYVIEASTDPIEWTEVGVVTAGRTGQIEYHEPHSANLDHRFYRLRGP